MIFHFRLQLNGDNGDQDLVLERKTNVLVELIIMINIKPFSSKFKYINYYREETTLLLE
jgi:hypothetical protein